MRNEDDIYKAIQRFSEEFGTMEIKTMFILVQNNCELHVQVFHYTVSVSLPKSLHMFGFQGLLGRELFCI